MNVTTDFQVFTVKDIETFGNRLHINTAANTMTNGLAAYLIFKHSTKAMKMTKKFILLTIFGAYLLDFHVSFIFGLFTLIPSTLCCSAGITRNFGWKGVVANFALMHITVSFGGMAIFFSLLYQYHSLNNNAEIFYKPKIIAAMLSAMILYGVPPAAISASNTDYEYANNYIKEHVPQHYHLFLMGLCFTNRVNIWILIWVLDVVFQIVLAYSIAVIFVIKIMRKLQSLKSSMSPENLKIQKQFFMALIAQLSIPFIFMVLPLSFLVINLALGVKDIAEISHWVMQFFCFHSSGNAIAVMIIFKPYRLTLIRWLKRIKRLIFCRAAPVENLVLPLPISLNTSSGIHTLKNN